MSRSVAAIDLGATSGRVVLARFESNRLQLEVINRFANQPLQLPSGLHWNLPALFQGSLDGLGLALSHNSDVLSVGVDSWAIDYGLLHRGRLLGLPYHYRDARSHKGVELVHGQIPFGELYQRNGLQFLHFNTLYQLATEEELLDAADGLLLIPDLISYWLTGARGAEVTNASTTGLLGVHARRWDTAVLDAVGISAEILPPLIRPGERVGRLRSEVRESLGIGGQGPDLIAVGSHDTASAVLAIPFADQDAAYISCGTWGLVGLELSEPVLSEDAASANFTNERSVNGGIRFLTNAMGLWLLNQTLDAWKRQGTPEDLEGILRAAERARSPVRVFDVSDPRFQHPGNMAPRIRSWYLERDLPAPEGRPELIRAIIESLAHAFAKSVLTAEKLANRHAPAIHMVGGGALNALLCQLTADLSGRPVYAGPVEATALGNALVQARTAGLIPAEPDAAREIVRASFEIQTYFPRDG